MTEIMSVVTIICLVFVSVQDLRDREFYTFPVNVLTLYWCVVTIQKSNNPSFDIFLVLISYLMIYAVFNHFEVWGEGDSDLFLLMSMTFQAVIYTDSLLENIMLQLIMLVGVLCIAIFIGFTEMMIKGERINKFSNIAVAPGFLGIVCVLLWKGVWVC